MKSQKAKLIFLTGVMVVLALIAVGVSFQSRLGPERLRPLEDIPDENIGRVLIQQPAILIVLERGAANSCKLREPMEDEADGSAVDSLVSTLRGVSIGSVISEKKEKYPTFELAEGQATHLQVYDKDGKKALLDLFVGKQGAGYGSCYVRFPNKDEVYLAENLPSWVVMRPPDDFRKRTMFSGRVDELSKLKVTGERLALALERSSSTWQVAGSTKVLAAPAAATLFNQLGSLRITNFIDKPDVALKTGLSKPYFSIEAESETGPILIEVGGKEPAPKGQPAEAEQRYLRVKGRQPLLLVSSSYIDLLVKALKNLPK